MTVPATVVTYLFDPLCGWCYGATKGLQALAEEPGIELVLAPTGLFSGTGARQMDSTFAAYAWENDQRIERLTGQHFSELYRDRILTDHQRLFDSGPATVALTAVYLQQPDAERLALKAIQEARYIQGLDNTDLRVLADVLRGLGLDQIADRVAQPDDELLQANRARTTAHQALMTRFGLRGVPSLLVGSGQAQRPLDSRLLYGNAESLFAGIRAAA